MTSLLVVAANGGHVVALALYVIFTQSQMWMETTTWDKLNARDVQRLEFHWETIIVLAYVVALLPGLKNSDTNRSLKRVKHSFLYFSEY